MGFNFARTKFQRADAMAWRRLEARARADSPCYAGPAAAAARKAEFLRARQLRRAPTEPATDAEVALAGRSRHPEPAARAARAGPAVPAPAVLGGAPADLLPVLGRCPSSPDEGHWGVAASDC